MAEPDFNTRIIEEFRANAGVVGGPFEGATLLLLHTDGAPEGSRPPFRQARSGGGIQAGLQRKRFSRGPGSTC